MEKRTLDNAMQEAELPTALRSFDQLPNTAHVRQPIVRALFSCSDATVWRRVKDGGIPRPYKLSTRVTAWNVGELRCALSALKEEDRGHGVTSRSHVGG